MNTTTDNTVRLAAAQTKNRTIPFRIGGPEAALSSVQDNIEALVALVHRAADEGCVLAAFPEDCLGTLEWEAGNREQSHELLVSAGELMLRRLSEVARERELAIVCCNDLVDDDSGETYNTAIILGPDGSEVGRYRKVQPSWSERHCRPGDTFPVFDVPGVGATGLCICYDMVFPETTRALALNGADLVIHCTMGGASYGEGDASLAAFRTRAADNFLYLIVAFRNSKSMVIGPKGQILAEADGSGDQLVMVDVDLTAGREAGDALGGTTADFRARLFRERNPAAYSVLTQDDPPALARLSDVPLPTTQEAGELFAEGITTGTERFYEAERMKKEGDEAGARRIYEELVARFGTLWMGRVSRERLDEMGGS
jgi:predicted amidohydrolase